MGTILDKELWDEYLKEYTDEMDKMQTLADANVFIKDNIIEVYKDKNIQKETLKSHIMYRVNLGTEGERPFLLDVKGEGKRYKYEFLVEFDTDTPEYGIYYGCRAVIDPTIQDEKLLEAQIKLINKDWTDIRGEVKKVLNNVFTNKRFVKRTFRRTNNKSNNHYWPFWIALGDEEDVVEVASRATLLIANMYSLKYGTNGKWLFEGINMDSRVETKKSNEKNEEYIETKTNFTLAALGEILEELEKDKTVKERKEKFRNFIERAENEGYIVRNKHYELCWDVVGENTKIKDFAATFRSLCEGKLSYSRVPWKWADKLFSSELKGNDKDKKGNIITSLLS